MSTYDDFMRFIAWANKEGFDVAHSVGDGKYICLNPETANLWKAWKASKYTPSPAQPVAKMAPVQGWPAGIPWSLHLEAYAEYCKRHGAQPALIDLEGRNCRGGFGVRELDSFIPGWRDRCGEIAYLKAEVARLNALLAAAPQPAQPSAQGEAVAWLVEWKAHGHGPQWWGFNHTPGKNATWCSDSNNAIRFARKEDAERMRLHIIAVAGLTGMHDYERSVSVTEHMWPDAASAPAAPAQAVPLAEPFHGKRYQQGDWSTRNWEAMCEDVQEGKS